ncbi:Cas10/Cmr2 second palm domain-containing protein [Desulforamulus putei]|uniref:Cas10/Cmr2 second palm domain-containing protein n=1 Tax=Desulforamulus putei DSM 12395 TaxID=1121429 RepID=A0A1M4SH19_9FIRM|nr:hypothetical protein [Desulforamulus putei]SHE31479.1 hypothetical protein SAMN02745133_00117 [Desulforamulus putei DSM 12395]
MAGEYLLAAEADKIQDFIFRASQLQEVVGGSQILRRFCEEVPEYLRPRPAEVVVAGGGSFRLLFSSKEEAEQYGERLAEIYQRATGGSLTVADPVSVDGNFPEAASKAEKLLRRAKNRRGGAFSPVQMPYVAFCSVCGVGLARAWRQEGKGGARSQYLCASCLNKSREREDGRGEFLSSFYGGVLDEKDLSRYRWPKQAKDVACFDQRRHLAYLVADVNNMGRLFNRCDRAEMKELSQNMERIFHESLREPVKQLMERAGDDGKKLKENFIPFLPLILGGDDLFALLPAPWALDFTGKFVKNFNERIRKFVQDGLMMEEAAAPTINAAVVICKETYPFSLAHRRAEELLGKTKRLAVSLQYEEGINCSAVDCELISGSFAGEEVEAGKFRPSLRPYLVPAEGARGVPTGWGADLADLIQARYDLADLPQKRRARLREIFHLPVAGSREVEKTINRALREFVVRTQEVMPAGSGKENGLAANLCRALKSLGGGAEDREDEFLRKFGRLPKEKAEFGHGMPDLLRFWDFTFALDKKRSDYERGR